ncbi:MAG: hypothetical protein H6706_27690 [Myxococcales bacterium]|nr:hypothetical protein [Myxococcales bacterium]
MDDLLTRTLPWKGDALSAGSLETLIQAERGRQAEQVSTLERLRGRNATVQGALSQEIQRLDGLSRSLDAGEASFWDKVRDFFAFLPGVEKSQAPRSIEALLREQYATSQTRLAEAAAFADRLEAAEADLYDEIDRLNRKIIEAAENEELAAEHVLAVEAHRDALDRRLAVLEPGTAEARQVTAELDRARRVLAEHSVKLRLYDTAEERLDRLKAHTAQLAETIAQLRSDILRYVTAAGEQLDLVGGQINAVGAAADAAVVTLELKRALDGLTRTLDSSTRFVSETQRYFRENIDGLIDDLGRFDAHTEQVMAQNLAFAEAMDDLRIGEAVALARTRQGRT